ncbi:hypothetical protein pb186bvf_014157 [Paramecium bursaria]
MMLPNQLHKNHSAFLSSQFCPKTDRVKLQNMVPVQLNEVCFQQPGIRVSPPHVFHGIKPSQKPSAHKPNMSLQSKGHVNLEQFQEKLNLFSKKRDHSPILKKSDDARRNQSINEEHCHTPTINKFLSKSPSPLQVQESVAQLLQTHSMLKYPYLGHNDQQSPKSVGGQGKKAGLQIGTYSSIQQQFKSSSKQKGHNSANSVSYGAVSLAKQISNLIRKDQTQTPTKVGTTITTEHSKSKSVAEYAEQKLEKENDVNMFNGTPSTFLTSKISLDQHSVQQDLYQLGDSVPNKGAKSQNTQQSLQESFPVKTCINHKTKKAKYYNEENKNICYYCSKCAVKLAGRGMHFQELNVAKSAESEVVSFQMRSLECSKQSSQTEQQFKETQMQQFLQMLQHSSYIRQDLMENISAQNTKIKSWYDNQLKQSNELKDSLYQVLNEAHHRSIQKIQQSKQQVVNQIQQWLRVLHENEQQTNYIQKDIESNWDGVVEGIEVKSFQKIMAYFQKQFGTMSEMQDQIFNQSIRLNSLGHSDIQATIGLIAQNFELVDQNIPLIAQQLNDQPVPPIRTQPTPPKIRDDHIPNNRVKTDFSTQKESPQNFYQYFFEMNPNTAPTRGTNQTNYTNQTQQTIQTQATPQQDSKSPYRIQPNVSQHSNLYVSFENKDIFMNALESEKVKIPEENSQNTSKSNIMVLQSYRGSRAEIEEENDQSDSAGSPHSTPHSPASGQTKQQVQRTASKTPEDQSVPKGAFTKSKNTFRTLFDQQEEEPSSLKQSDQKQDSKISPARSEKFKSILNRISSNQSKTQQFYQNIIQSNAETPDIKKYEMQDTETCKKAIISNKQSVELKDSVQQMNMCDDLQDLSDYENDDDKEVQAMFSSKEMKVSERKLLTVPSDSSQNNSNMEIRKDPYQKTLFCSPTFKDQDLLNVSDSSIE